MKGLSEGIFGKSDENKDSANNTVEEYKLPTENETAISEEAEEISSPMKKSRTVSHTKQSTHKITAKIRKLKHTIVHSINNTLNDLEKMNCKPKRKTRKSRKGTTMESSVPVIAEETETASETPMTTKEETETPKEKTETPEEKTETPEEEIAGGGCSANPLINGGRRKRGTARTTKKQRKY